MKADLTRSTFDPSKHFSQVLMQQGRVQLDADWNEQVSILLHYQRTLASDILGSYGGPEEDTGFEIFTDISKIPEEERRRLGGLDDDDFVIGKGRYYVDGMLCENESHEKYTAQPDLPDPGPRPRVDEPYLVYLDVWERHKTAIEEPGIREVALGGPDTATRAEVVWQVKVTRSPDVQDDAFALERDKVWEHWSTDWVPHLQPENRGMLVAECSDEPGEGAKARYRGLENQLYRVEIHAGGKAVDGDPSFKWSRDNGSLAFAIRALNGNEVTLESLGRDDHLTLKPKDLVEIVDDDYVLRGSTGPLLRVDKVDTIAMKVVLDREPSNGVGEDLEKHPLLRRWDHGAGAAQKSLLGDNTILLEEEIALPLEDGIQIRFQSARGNHNDYRTGDYWLIPARAATHDVQWPEDGDGPKAQPPDGVKHYYAPLAIIGDGEPVDCRRPFEFRDLQRRVGVLEADVGNLKSDVGNLKSEVDDLKDRVGALERRQRILLVLDLLIIVFLVAALILLLA